MGAATAGHRPALHVVHGITELEYFCCLPSLLGYRVPRKEAASHSKLPEHSARKAA